MSVEWASLWGEVVEDVDEDDDGIETGEWVQ